MVFVDKSLERMIEEIGGITSQKTDDFVTSPNGYCAWIHRYVRECRSNMIHEHAPNGINIEHAKNEMFGSDFCPSILSYLLENCVTHAYEEHPNKPIVIKYFFGLKGLVFQVIDSGKGFDSKNLITSCSTSTLTKGKHYKGENKGTQYLLQPQFQATIDSRQQPPTGTTVTVMYKY